MSQFSIEKRTHDNKERDVYVIEHRGVKLEIDKEIEDAFPGSIVEEIKMLDRKLDESKS